MTDAPIDPAALRALLPESAVGAVTAIEPIRVGMSGAGVYAVTSDRGQWVLRVQNERVDSTWDEHLLILRRAAEHGVAPAVVHVDESARAVVTQHIAGIPLPSVLADAKQRDAFLGGLVGQLRTLHGIDADGVEERDPVGFARDVWESQRARAGYPDWAREVGPTLDSSAQVLANDPRRVLGHNDLNPTNILWDGTRAWLVDWDAAGLAHPFYDLAVFAMFLNLEPDPAHGLLALQQGSRPSEAEQASFAQLRTLAALLTGCLFLRQVADLSVLQAPTRSDAPTLGQCRAGMRSGALDLNTPRGRVAFGLALLRVGTETTP